VATADDNHIEAGIHSEAPENAVVLSELGDAVKAPLFHVKHAACIDPISDLKRFT
jgi:hypothetical protein